jgi:hypothetical protein
MTRRQPLPMAGYVYPDPEMRWRLYVWAGWLAVKIGRTRIKLGPSTAQNRRKYLRLFRGIAADREDKR